MPPVVFGPMKSVYVSSFFSSAALGFCMSLT